MNIRLPNEHYHCKLETIAPGVRLELLNRQLSEFITSICHNHSTIGDRFNSADIAPESVKSVKDLERLPVIWVEETNSSVISDDCFTIFTAENERKKIRPDDRWAQALYAAGIRRDIVLVSMNRRQAALANALDNALTDLGAVPVPALTNDIDFQLNVMEKLGVSAFVGSRERFEILLDHSAGTVNDLHGKTGLETVFLIDQKINDFLSDAGEIQKRLKVRSSFGTAELGCLGFECFHLNGFHIPENVIIEIVDPETECQVAHGQRGYLVVTVCNPLKPLLRVGLKTCFEFRDDECPCGRTTPRLMYPNQITPWN